MSTVTQLARLLERTGLPASDPLEIGEDIARDLNDVHPGVAFGGTHAEVVPAMWQRARAGGAQSLTLKLEVEDDGYHTRITVLEQLAVEGRHAERLTLATRWLEAHPEAVELQVHRVLATLELDGLDAARAALREATRGWVARGARLPEALLEAYRILAVRGLMLEDEELDLDAEILEIAAVLPSGFYRVTFASGCATRMSAGVLERLYRVRVGAPSRLVH